MDPELLLGLQNSRQNKNSLELQREILAMQKLQVLNQVRISKGLPPLAELPKPPPESREDNTFEGFLLALVLSAIITFAGYGLYWLFH